MAPRPSSPPAAVASPQTGSAPPGPEDVAGERAGRSRRLLGLRLGPLVGGALILLLALALNDYRHLLTPDLHIDELIYTSVGQNLSTGHGLSVQGQPFFWQPPLFFLLEWPIVWVTHLGGQGTFDAAVRLRLLNGAIGALTAAGVFALGWRLRGAWAAWPMALLFITDPFVVRVTRRMYLEPFAAMWVLAAMGLLYTSLGRWTWRRRLAVGLLLGCALLSKELTAYAFAVPLVLWARRELGWREPVAIISTAVAAYLVYPLWASAEGLGSQLLSIKRFQYDRLVGVYHINGFAKPGFSFVDAVIANAGDYWTSYACIALGVPMTAWLWFRRDRAGRFLAAWAVAGYAFIAVMAKFGSLEDQFFYYLMLPVLGVLGYGFALLLRRVASRLGTARRQRSGLALFGRTCDAGAVVLLGLIVAAVNMQVWALRFGRETDDGYLQLIAAIDRSVPHGAIIAEPGGGIEQLRFAYPQDQYQLLHAKDPRVLRARNVHWYVLSSKDISLANGIDQRYYDYLTSHATRIWGVDEHSYFDFGLWYVQYPASLPDVTFPLPPDPPVIQPT